MPPTSSTKPLPKTKIGNQAPTTTMTAATTPPKNTKTNKDKSFSNAPLTTKNGTTPTTSMTTMATSPMYCPPKLNTYASLWQQDNLGYKYFSNVYSLYQPGYQSYYNYLGYYFSTYNKRFQLYFGDYNGPRVALKEGMVFDLGLEFDIPDGPLQGRYPYYHQSQLLNWETGHYTAEIINGQLHLHGDGTVAYRVSANLYMPMERVTVSHTITTSELNDLAYQYKYDQRNRLIEKKIPGKDWEYIVYDKLDRPVMTQDANLRAAKKWLFTKYDVFGRVAYTGIYTHTILSTQSSMQSYFGQQNQQNTVNAAAKLYERRQTTATNHYYTNRNFPTTNIEYHTLNYYDNYTFDRAGAATTATALWSGVHHPNQRTGNRQ